MKWVVLAIILSIGVYTFLTLKYRRPDRAFRPYQDLRDRANVHRLLDAGFQRIALEADLPADALTFESSVRSSAAAGKPSSSRRSSPRKSSAFPPPRRSTRCSPTPSA